MNRHRPFHWSWAVGIGIAVLPVAGPTGYVTAYGATTAIYLGARAWRTYRHRQQRLSNARAFLRRKGVSC